MKGFIVYPSYEHINGETIIQLFGRLENGQSFVTLNKIEPYFFIKTNEIKKIKKYLQKYNVENTKFTNFRSESVSKISSKNNTDLKKLYDLIKDKVDTYEADIKPHYRFIMDLDLLGNINIEGDYESSERVDRVYNNPVISPVKEEFKPNLKVVSIDIETIENKLICIGLFANGYKKNFIISNKKLNDAISCKSEEDVLKKFKAEILRLDPDIITGWNVIDFDFKFLQNLCRRNKIKFDIGRDLSEPRMRFESNFFRSSSIDLAGRQVLDTLNFIKDPFIQEAPSVKFAEFDSYSLEDVAQAFLKEGKTIKGKGNVRHAEVEKLYEVDQQKVVDYNLTDCELVLKILDKTKIIDLAIERSQLNGMPLDRLTSSIAAFDSLYIREAGKKGLVSPTLRYTEKEEKIMGGFVKEPLPGIYHNVLVLDFKSLYPSILRTFNIDPSSLVDKPGKVGETIESPNKVYFKNQEGILPGIIEKLHKAREKSKREKRELSSYAIKIIMNSFWGVLASPNCRYFSFNMASSITNFAQFIIKLTAKEIEKLGYQTIYSDTDSVFINTNLEKKEATELGKKIEEHINQFYDKYVKENYHRESFLELQFEKIYFALLMPKIRGSELGAKKRYAGLIEKNGKEEIQVVGLEAIRGDWTDAAKEFQMELLNKIFHKQEIFTFIKSYIKNLKEGKIDEKLIYKKSIRKSLEQYTKTTPPHVKAARKLDKLDSNIIRYYITLDGPEPLEKLKHKIDYDHYIKKQIEPIANQILAMFNKSLEDLIKGNKQSKLF